MNFKTSSRDRRHSEASIKAIPLVVFFIPCDTFLNRSLKRLTFIAYLERPGNADTCVSNYKFNRIVLSKSCRLNNSAKSRLGVIENVIGYFIYAPFEGR